MIKVLSKLTVLCFCLSPILSVNITCIFRKYAPPYNYTCIVLDVEILHEHDPIVMRGQHLSGKTNFDVNDVSFLSSEVRYFPIAIFTIFPNVRFLNAKASRKHNLRRTVMKKCGKIISMNFDHNRMTNLTRHIFKYAPKLLKISLRNNAINYVDEKAFAGLYYLAVLHLQKNYIFEFFPKSFNDLHRLKEFYAYGNRLIFIPKGLFDKNILLEHLSLDKNMLRVIDPKISIKLVYLKVLDLRYNVCINKDFFEANYAIESIMEALGNCTNKISWEAKNGTWTIIEGNSEIEKVKQDLKECRLTNDAMCEVRSQELNECIAQSEKFSKNCTITVSKCTKDREKIQKDLVILKRKCSNEHQANSCKQNLDKCLTECSYKEEKFTNQCIEYILNVSQDFATYKHMARLNVSMYEHKLKSCKRVTKNRRLASPCVNNSNQQLCQSIGKAQQWCDVSKNILEGFVSGVYDTYEVVDQVEEIINETCNGFSTVADDAMCN